MRFNETNKLLDLDDFNELPIEEKVKNLHKSATKDIERAISESGKSKVVWIATSSDAAQMLYEWSELQAAIKAEHDVDLPDLIDGVTITAKD